MRIAIFTDTFLPDINGVATSVAILHDELVSHGHDVMIVTTVLPKGSTYQERYPVVRIHGFDLKHLYGYRLAPLYSFEGMKEIKAFDPQVIHCQTEFGIGLFGRIVAKSLGIPSVYTYHTMWEDYTHYLTKGLQPIDRFMKKLSGKISVLYGDHCTQIITPSDKSAIALHGYGVKHKIHVIPTGLNLKNFDDAHRNEAKIAAIREQYHCDEHFTILYLGRIAKEKSIDFLIMAMKKIIPIRRDAQLLIVGAGPGEKSLKELTKRQQLTDYVKFAGEADSSEVPSYYHAADVFASASMSETQGLTYIEAMASGLPVFARYDRNLENVIVDGKNGIFFTNEHEYITKLMQLTDEEMKTMGQASRELAQHFSSVTFGEKVIEVYKKALEDYKKDYRVTAVINNEKGAVITISDGAKQQSLKVSKKSLDTYHIKVNSLLKSGDVARLLDLEKVRGCYNQALKYLSYHDYSEHNLKERLLSKGTWSISQVEMTMALLRDKSLINDFDYAHDQIAKGLRHGYGFDHVKRDLLKAGVEENMIDEALSEFDDDELIEEGIKVAEKMIASNHRHSKKALESKIQSKLFARGFTHYVVEEVMKRIDTHMSEEDSYALLAKQYEKAYNRYAKKYQGSQLKMKLKSFLLTKGFDYDEINAYLDEVWSEE
jgi:1,2-diacylglycerol 3-alpha-glucosyltransferase